MGRGWRTSADGRVKVREPGDRQGARLGGPGGQDLARRISPDGRLLARATSDATPAAASTSGRSKSARPAQGDSLAAGLGVGDRQGALLRAAIGAWPGQAMNEVYFSPNGERLAVAYLARTTPRRYSTCRCGTRAPAGSSPTARAPRPRAVPDEFATS